MDFPFYYGYQPQPYYQATFPSVEDYEALQDERQLGQLFPQLGQMFPSMGPPSMTPPFGGGPSQGPPFGGPGQGPPFGGPGQGQQGGPPSSPPPSFVPTQQAQTFAVDPGGIARCLFRYTYVWLNNRQQFWFYPVFVGRQSVAGWRWTGFRWMYFGIDLRQIQSFTCF